VEGVNSHYKHFHKDHNVPPPSTTIKKIFLKRMWTANANSDPQMKLKTTDNWQ
jgi:hypothetical protein